MQLWTKKEDKSKQWEITSLGAFPDLNFPLTLLILEILRQYPDKKEIFIVFNEAEKEKLQEHGKIYYAEDNAEKLFLEQVVCEYIDESSVWSTTVEVVQEDPNTPLAHPSDGALQLSLKIRRL